MANIVKKQLKTKINGVTTDVYPYAHMETVVDDNGNTLKDTLDAINKEIDELASSADVPEGVTYIDFEESEDAGELLPVDADTLDGHNSEYFATAQSVIDTLEAAKEYNNAAYANANLYTDQKIADLINGADTTLDTLGEIAQAMKENEDVVTALDASIGKKANQAELDTHIGNDIIHITKDERSEWSAKVSQEELQAAIDSIASGETPTGNSALLNGLTSDKFMYNAQKYGNTYFGSYDLNDWKFSGCYGCVNATQGAVNYPPNTDGWGTVLVVASVGDRVFQIFQPWNKPTEMYWRALRGSDGWLDWALWNDGGNALKLNGLKAEEFVSNENLIINPEFEVGATDITNKAGGTTAIASKWTISTHSNITYSAEHTENGLKITSQNGTDGGWLNLQQVHTDFIPEDGTYTLSFYCDKPENIRQCGFATTHATVNGGGYAFKINGNVVSTTVKLTNVTGMSAFIQLLNEACDVTIKWVKLERGSVATPFIPPNKEVEKLKCSIVDMSTHWATDLNAEFGLGFKVCKYSGSTLNTPYTEGLTESANGGECMSFGFSEGFGMQVAMPAGYKKLCIRNITDGTFGEWSNSADGGNADTVGGKHEWQLVTYLGEIKDINIVKDANYPGAPYEGVINDTMADEIGLPHAYWHIKFYRHAHNNGHGFQEVKPLNSSTEVPRYRGSSGTKWSAWKTGFIPIDGSTPMSGNLKIQSGDFSTVEVRTTDVATKGKGTVEVGVNHVNLRAINDDTHKNYRSLVVNNSAREGDIKNALQFSETVNSVNTVYTVLHTGNSHPTVVTDIDIEVGATTSYADGTIIFVKETT